MLNMTKRRFIEALLLTSISILVTNFIITLFSSAQDNHYFVEQPLYGAKDNGINILLDHSHEFTFFCAWDIPPILREGGFRKQRLIQSLLKMARAGYAFG